MTTTQALCIVFEAPPANLSVIGLELMFVNRVRICHVNSEAFVVVKRNLPYVIKYVRHKVSISKQTLYY